MARETTKRPYRMRKRAERQELTRRRITESAVELHGTLGPARTSFSAVAAHAGVTRSTLYRHFPDEAALYAACSAHWREANPRPDLERWATVGDPDERLATALAELYAYYRRTEGMFANILRDEAVVPNVARTLRAYHDYLAQGAGVLIAGRGERGGARSRVRAAIGLSLAFATWRSIARDGGLDDEDAARLMCDLVAAAGSARR